MSIIQLLEHRFYKSFRGLRWVSVTLLVAAISSVLLIALANAFSEQSSGVLETFVSAIRNNSENPKPALVAGIIVSVLASVIVDTFFVPKNNLERWVIPVLISALITVILTLLLVLDLLKFEIADNGKRYLDVYRNTAMFVLLISGSILKSYSFEK